MPGGFTPIVLRPGIQAQFTATLNEGGYSDGNLIRWKDGLPQKLGGWTKFSNDAFIGHVRGMHAWADLGSNTYLAGGTASQLAVIRAGVLYDITPLRATVNITPDFSTVIGDTEVIVGDTAHGASAGDRIDIFVPVSVGGLILFGGYEIDTIVDNDNYTITAASPATATVSGGGAVPEFVTTNTSNVVTVNLANHGLSPTQQFIIQVSTAVGGLTLDGTYTVQTVPTANSFTIQASSVASSSASAFENTGNARILYYIGSGNDSTMLLQGYGSGGYGTGPYGDSSSVISYEPPRIWSLDNWGEQLIANYNEGPIYVWVPPVSVGNQATEISAAPDMVHSIFVAMPQRQLVALGAETGSVFDPLLVRWSDIEDYNDWTATSTNQAGSYRIPTGSLIVGGMQGNQQGLIWTDLDMWTMQYVQPPFVYGFQKVAAGCGLIATHAFAILGQLVVWMSHRGFFIYRNGGGVTPLQCDVWDYVFKNIDDLQSDKICAVANSLFNEISFFFPSASGGTQENDLYVKVNLLNPSQPLWDYGTLGRTSGIDQSVVGPPCMADLSGYIQQHETSDDADGAAMDSRVKTGQIDIAEGDLLTFVRQFYPDAVLTGSGAEMFINFEYTNYPNETPAIKGPFALTASTDYISPRFRGRQVAFEIGSEGLGSFWRLGKPRYRGAPAGKR